MRLDGSLLGLDPTQLAVLSALLAIAVALVLAIVASRSRGRARAIAGASAFAALTCIPADDTGLATLGLAVTTLLFVLASPAFGRIGGARRLRALRVALLRMPRRSFDAAIFATTFGIALALSWALFDGTAVIQDSQAQLFHARILASGHLTLPPPACADHLLADHVIVSPRLYSQYPPGHVAVLALGVLAHAPVLVCPLLGGAGVVAIGWLARTLHGEQTARRAMLLGVVSPFVLLMSSEAMSHATGLVLYAGALIALVRFRRSGSLGSAIAIGVLFGALLLTRPVTAIALALPAGGLLLVDALKTPQRWRGVLVAAIAGGAVASLLLAWNQATNGSPWTMGYVVRWGPLHTFGFHDSPWGDPHTPLRGALHTLSSTVAWNAYLFGGPIPAVLLLALGAHRDRASGITWVLVLAPVTILVVHAFYFFHDLVLGPRYLYEANAAALVLAARGLGGLAIGPAPRRVLGGEAIALVLAALTFWPYALWSYHIGYCPRGGLVDRTMRSLDEAGVTGPAIVFVDEPYERAFFAVDPDLTANRVLFVRDLGDERDEACMASLPGRDPWRVRNGSLRSLRRD